MVSVIVTVLTYTFFKEMEHTVNTSTFNQISTNLVADSVKSLNKKASSTKALSKTFTGILGVQSEKFPADKPVNEPPSVIVSPKILQCAERERAEGMSANWKRIWPNVTLPGHDAIVSAMLEVSKSRAAVFAPLLWGDHAAWEEFAAAEALSLVEDIVSNGIRNSEYLVDEEQTLSSDSLSSLNIRVPVWQVAPAELMNEGIMWDLFSHPPYKAPIDRILNWRKEEEEAPDVDQMPRSLKNHEKMGGRPPVAATELIRCNETLLPIHRNSITDMDQIQLSGSGDKNLLYGHRRSRSPETANDVCSALFYPVYDNFTSDDGPANITGVVAEIFSWSDIFMQIHHGSSKKVEVVIESKLEGSNEPPTTASYHVDNNEVRFVGLGRRVDHGDGALVQKYDFSFDQDAVIHTFEIYSIGRVCYHDMVSRKPSFLAIIAACFFFLSVIVFFVYDYFVK